MENNRFLLKFVLTVGTTYNVKVFLSLEVIQIGGEMRERSMPHCSISGQSEIQSQDKMRFPATLDVPTNQRENMFFFTFSTWIYLK